MQIKSVFVKYFDYKNYYLFDNVINIIDTFRFLIKEVCFNNYIINCILNIKIFSNNKLKKYWLTKFNIVEIIKTTKYLLRHAIKI